MQNNSINRDTLVAIIKEKSDLRIALEQNWYRIPVLTKRTPRSVKENYLKYIAFYQTSIFKERAFRIEWFGKVSRISVVKRKELFPELTFDPKVEEEYYKIEFEKPEKLSNPIISARHRRMLFVNTTYERLISSKEFNDLFIESPIEEKLWSKLIENDMAAERQYMYQIAKRIYYLDFALFCRERNLDVECDGDSYHHSVDAVNYDKNRNNILEEYGWAVLRYPTNDITNNLNSVISQIKKTINRNGGLKPELNDKDFKYFPKDDMQIDLF